jgi:hypothetical protein
MEDLAADSEASLKRRRGPAYVTSNACVECKRKKAKVGSYTDTVNRAKFT